MFSHAVTAASLVLLAAAATAAPLPERLEATGLGHAGVMSFVPQYPLWSDGADKRRWIALPRGATIDASKPDAWQFPRGTKLWKEFSVGGRKVETRYVTRAADGTWQFASYAWNAEGTEARLVAARGTVIDGVAGAPQGRYEIPSRSDCLACHESAAVPVLGVGALQLSPDRDPLVPRAGTAGDVDLPGLIARRLLRGYRGPAAPRVAASTPEARAALGVLHANCGHCHNESDHATPVPITLAQSVAEPQAAAARVLTSIVDTPSRMTGTPAAVPGRPETSLLVERMRSRDPRRQMPPLGTRVPDAESLVLVERWIARHLNNPETQP